MKEAAEQAETDMPAEVPPAAAPAATSAAEPATKPKKPGSNRGVETMFRTVFQNHISLTQLADTKANIMISINGLILSVIMAGLLPRLPLPPAQALPFGVLIGGCLLSLLFAVAAARPRITERPIALEDVPRNRGNLLFFGSFLQLDEAAFEEGMRALIADRELLYGNLTRDLYGLGLVLDRKYRRLRASYNAFAATLLLAGASYLPSLLSP